MKPNTFIELRNLLDKDDDAWELLHPIISRLYGVCHFDGENILFVKIVIDGLKRSEAVLRGLIRRIICERGIAVIKTGFWVTHNKNTGLARGGGKNTARE